jgi:Flp pilus assembly protein TadD
MSGRLEEAIPFFQRAVDLHPAFVNSYKNLGAIYNILGRKAEAEEAERHVQELAAEQPG